MAMEKKEKPGVMLYWETFEAAEDIEPEEKAKLWDAIYQYTRYGVNPEFVDKTLKVLWKVTQHSLDLDDEKYKQKIEDRTIKGWTSEFKNRYAIQHGIDPNNEAELHKYIEMRKATADDKQSSTNCSQLQSTAANCSQPTSISSSISASSSTATTTSAPESILSSIPSSAPSSIPEKWNNDNDVTRDCPSTDNQSVSNGLSKVDLLMQRCNQQAYENRH